LLLLLLKRLWLWLWRWRWRCGYDSALCGKRRGTAADVREETAAAANLIAAADNILPVVVGDF
jgi:hypothetical protein